MGTPRCADMHALRRLCRYLAGKPRLVYYFPWQEPGLPLRVHCDTDFAGCVQTRRSTSGGCASRGGHLIKRWSVTQKAITLSSGEAELGGVVKGAAVLCGRRREVPQPAGAVAVVAGRRWWPKWPTIDTCGFCEVCTLCRLCMSRLRRLRSRRRCLRQCATDGTCLQHPLDIDCMRSGWCRGRPSCRVGAGDQNYGRPARH